MRDFHDRLTRCMRIGQLAFGDLHHWFDRPRPTVRTWVELRHTPRGPAGDLAVERLALLEQAIKQKRGFPVPRTLSARKRPEHIRRVRDELERGRVFTRSAA